MTKQKSGIANRGNRKNPSLQEKIMRYSRGKGLDKYNFSYRIASVNQFAVLKNKWYDLDYIDIVIFNVIKDFIVSGRGDKHKITDSENVNWYFVAENLIIQYLPLLPINSPSSINKRITKLCKYDLIIRKPDNHQNCKKYIRIGGNAELLIYTNKESD